jgi:hypothetical protein
VTAGNQYTAQTINNNAAAAVTGVRDALAYLMQQYNWLNQLGLTGIENAPAVPGGTQINPTDAGNILAAVTDLAGLAQFFNGQAVTLGFGAAHVTGTYNFMTFGQLLTNGQ